MPRTDTCEGERLTPARSNCTIISSAKLASKPTLSALTSAIVASKKMVPETVVSLSSPQT